MKWTDFLTIDTFIFLIIFIAVIWCVVTKKHKSKSSSSFNLKSYADIFKYKTWKNFSRRSLSSTPKRKRKLNKHEEKCREIFQKIYSRPFKSVRPDFLKNPTTGKNLELDGYCPDIITHIGRGLAFEYDGIQHSKHTGMFHRKKHDFEYQCAKDSWKDKRCKELGIVLIRIPHFVIYDDLEKYITDILIKKKVYINDIKMSLHSHASLSGISSSAPKSIFLGGLYD